MKVYIRTADGKKFWVPLPYWILKLSTGDVVEKIIKKYVPAEQRPYVDLIDFSKLRGAIELLKEYRGLNIVDVKAKDGTVVNVKL